MTLSLKNQRMLGVVALVALAAACSGNGAPATITPDPTNPMNPMGYRAGPPTSCQTSVSSCAVTTKHANR